MMDTPIAIVDYGMGNIRSVVNALREVGARGELIRDPEVIAGKRKIILPGVGAFGQAMGNLRRDGIDTALKEAHRSGALVLGICLGMQLMFAESSEGGTHKGLNWIEGEVRRFPDDGQLRVPHMGWNSLTFTRHHELTQGLDSGLDVYFLHSYHCVCAEEGDVLATSDYGVPFVAMVARENLFGIQFHPEKSQQTGLALLRNFTNL